nr:precorrin-2 C(20)-methyltransferase [Candidatus Competibacter phosphatis]
KIKPMLDELLDLLERRGIAQHAVYVEKVGTPEERVVRNVLSLRDETVPYLSLLLVRNPLRSKQPIPRGCRPQRVREAAS